MPKLGVEPLRRAAVVDATIDCIGRAGSLDVTVGQIARKAGVSTALAHHYFGAKDQIFLAAMRHILSQFSAAVRRELIGAQTPRQRLDAIVRANFEGEQFQAPIVSAWLNFYLQAHHTPEAQRLLHVYQKRLRSNLLHDLRPLIGDDAETAAETIAALIDGIYIRAALGPEPLDGQAVVTRVLAVLDLLVGATSVQGAGQC